nr:class I SAM-dependent methyltransferase [Bacteroidota bacterium]
MSEKSKHVCPVEIAGGLDNRMRRWAQNPRKILGPYIKKGMVVLDVGCGPGFFSIEMAKMVGETGRVIAADLQEGMLQKIRDKIRGTEFEDRLTIHKCDKDKIGLSEQVDLILLFYMVHEVPDVESFLSEIESLLKPGGLVFIVEPPFHVSKKAFENTLKIAGDNGLTITERPKLFLNKAAILQK